MSVASRWFAPHLALVLLLVLGACQPEGAPRGTPTVADRTPSPAPAPQPQPEPQPEPQPQLEPPPQQPLRAELPPFPPLARAPRWLEGDLHVHDDHSSDGSLPRQISDDRLPGNVAVSDQIGLAELRGLDFLPLTDHRSFDQHYDPLWRSSSLLLLTGEEANGSPHATVQGAIDTVVQGASVEGERPLRRLQQSIWDAHAQNANWVTAHPDDGEVNDDGTPNDLADAVGVDLVEVWNKASNVEVEIDYAENRWTAGYRFGVAGASDSHFRELWAIAGPGQPRTGAYAQLPTERGLLSALRSGRTRLRADGDAPRISLQAVIPGAPETPAAMAGDELIAPIGTPVVLEIEVDNALGAEVLVYQAPGRSAGPLQRVPMTVSSRARWSLPLQVTAQPHWVRVELRGPGAPAGIEFNAFRDDPLGFVLAQPAALPRQLLALSAPVFLSSAPVEPQPTIPLPADRGGDDGAVLVLGEAGRFVGFPDVARAGEQLHVIAEAHDEVSSRIVYRRRGADGRWAPPQLLSDQGVAARFPRIAARGNQVWAVWQDASAREIPRRPRILLRRSSDGGASWAPIELVRALDGRAEHPALALTPDGLPVVAWQEMRDGQAFEIAVQVLGRDQAPLLVSAEGKTTAAASPLDPRSARFPASVWPALAVAPEGEIAVAWQDNRSDPDPLWTGATGAGEGSDPDHWQIMIRRRAAGQDDWSGPEVLGDDARADRHPALTYDGRGRLAAAWDSRTLRASGANLRIEAARSEAPGQWGGPHAVFEDVHAMSQAPRLATDSDGAVRAAWYDGRSADWRWRIATARLDHEGNWGAASLLPGRGNSSWPALAADTVVFASTRAATRLQRDPTQGIAVREFRP